MPVIRVAICGGILGALVLALAGCSSPSGLVDAEPSNLQYPVTQNVLNMEVVTIAEYNIVENVPVSRMLPDDAENVVLVKPGYYTFKTNMNGLYRQKVYYLAVISAGYSEIPSISLTKL